MAAYLTSADDMIDDVCSQHYGIAATGAVEAVLDANPGLADRGPLLPAGLLIELPELPAESREGGAVRLWD